MEIAQNSVGPASSPDSWGMLIDPILTELWIVALCCIVNHTDAWPVHEDVSLAVAARGAARASRWRS